MRHGEVKWLAEGHPAIDVRAGHSNPGSRTQNQHPQWGHRWVCSRLAERPYGGEGQRTLEFGYRWQVHTCCPGPGSEARRKYLQKQQQQESTKEMFVEQWKVNLVGVACDEVLWLRVRAGSACRGLQRPRWANELGLFSWSLGRTSHVSTFYVLIHLFLIMC